MEYIEVHMREHGYLLLELRFLAFDLCMGPRLIKVVHERKLNNEKKI